MQTKEPKKLSISKLSEYPVISLDEQMMLKGGLGDNGASMYKAKYGETLPDGVGYNPSTDQCYALQSTYGYGCSGNNSGSYPQNNSSFNSSCPACYAFDQANHSVSGHNHQPITTPLGEFLLKYLPHKMGWGDHTGQ